MMSKWEKRAKSKLKFLVGDSEVWPLARDDSSYWPILCDSEETADLVLNALEASMLLPGRTEVVEALAVLIKLAEKYLIYPHNQVDLDIVRTWLASLAQEGKA